MEAPWKVTESWSLRAGLSMRRPLLRLQRQRRDVDDERLRHRRVPDSVLEVPPVSVHTSPLPPRCKPR